MQQSYAAAMYDGDSRRVQDSRNKGFGKSYNMGKTASWKGSANYSKGPSWSDYDKQAKTSRSKIRMSEAGNLAILPDRQAPLDLAVNWKKMSEQVAELIEKTEKSIKASKDSQAKALKAKTEYTWRVK